MHLMCPFRLNRDGTLKDLLTTQMQLGTLDIAVLTRLARLPVSGMAACSDITFCGIELMGKMQLQTVGSKEL